MDNVGRGLTVAIAGMALLWAGTALAATDAEKCEAYKLKHAGKYGFCRMKAESKAVKRSEPADFDKCDEKVVDKFGRAEDRWDPECPTSGDVGDIQSQVTECTDGLALALAAGTVATLIDNGDGTVTDTQTGLMWEKKDDNNVGGIHDYHGIYNWADAFSVFIDRLNNYCDDDEATACTTDADCVGAPDTYANNDLCGHAGYRDWRLAKRMELESILDLEDILSPTVSSEFQTGCSPGCTVTACSCTFPDRHWSSTPLADSPLSAWVVDFDIGFVENLNKLDNHYVRAVRGGL